MWGGHMMGGGGWGGGGGFFGLMPLLWLGLLIVVAVVLWRVLVRRRQVPGAMGEDQALSILKQRYARGEIDKADFDARKRDLQ